MSKKRLRIFAGPNGSGKSTIYKYISEHVGCPYFVNADEIHKSLSENGVLNFDKYAIVVETGQFIEALQNSSWIKYIRNISELSDSINVEKNKLYIEPKFIDGYFAAFISDFIRNNMLNIVHQFTIETVLSDDRKLEYIKLAKNLGYRIYLYFVSTKDVMINVKRVSQRVELGGHNVPEEKIKKRYTKSLQNLHNTIKLCDRAYLFDNSSESWILLAELDEDRLILHEDVIPAWLNDNLLNKMDISSYE